jgi:putative PIN family toxin of toxin-antitoxin system
VLRLLIDTNVLVSALRSSRGAAAELLRQLAHGKFEIVTSVALHLEYEEQLERLVGLGIASQQQALDVMNFISKIAVPAPIRFRLRPSLDDPDDDFALELAFATGVDYLVTHNRKDFQAAVSYGVHAVGPAEMLRLLEQEQ